MSKRKTEAAELLAVAARLRGFARQTEDLRYCMRFERGAEQLEIEAVGYAACDTVAHALRQARTKLNHRQTSVPC